jgi:hypothetical protein
MSFKKCPLLVQFLFPTKKSQALIRGKSNKDWLAVETGFGGQVLLYFITYYITFIIVFCYYNYFLTNSGQFD